MRIKTGQESLASGFTPFPEKIFYKGEKKMKKTLSQIIAVIGMLIAIVGIFLDAMELEMPAYAFSIMDLSFAVAIASLVLIFSKKEGAVSLGYLIMVVAGVAAITRILYPDEMFAYYEFFSFIDVGFAVMAVAALLYYSVKLLTLLGFVKKGKATTSEDVLSVLNKYKEMEKESIITAEEFEELKTKTLKVANKNVGDLEELKKWKKLVDQKVITEEEFAAMKGELFGKK